MLAAVLLAVVPATAAAQGPPGGGNDGMVLTDTWSVTVDRQLYIAVTNPTVSFPTPDALAFGNGFILQSSAPPVVTHRSNVAHSIHLEAGNGTFLTTGGSANPAKPSTDLEYRVNGGTWLGTPFGSTGPVHAAAPMGAHDGDDQVDFRVLLRYADDSPGTYTLDVVFTILAN